MTAEAQTFNGFPSSTLATPVPSLFFSEVMPQIDSAEELAVSVYFFFAQTHAGGPRRTPRFLTLGELRADATLLRTLTNIARLESNPAQALQTGLARAVQRGTIVQATLRTAEGEQEIYAVNVPANRRGLQALEGVELRLDSALSGLPPAEGGATPNIFALYEENIGNITPLIAEELADAEQQYSPEWIHDAFREAVTANKRSWRYIHTILRRWQAEGRDHEKPERDPEAEWFARRYLSGKRPRSGR